MNTMGLGLRCQSTIRMVYLVLGRMGMYVHIWNIEVCINQRLICTRLYGHVFGTLHFCPDNCVVSISESLI